MNMLYRIILLAEDGHYTLEDGYTSMSEAEDVADSMAAEYGEGQALYVEKYRAGYQCNITTSAAASPVERVVMRKQD